MKVKTLIIDDHHTSIAILEMMLADHCECSVATSGAKGIELFEQAYKENEPFQVVLLDIIMPEMDGVETLKKLRKIERPFLTIPLYQGQDRRARIIMQTSSENPKHLVDSYLQGKCNGFINKPYSREEIIEKVLGIKSLTERL